MKIERIGFNQQAVVVLGAGATRGASFVALKEKQGKALPPLDTDFFTQTQRLSQAKPKELLGGLIENTVDIFGKNFKLTMEGFLTHIEHLSIVYEDYKLTGRPAENPYPAIRAQFLQVLAALLDEAIGREPKCVFHEALVKSLSSQDMIISFNYDWLIDYALKIHGSQKWNSRKGYGVNVFVQKKKAKGTEYWAWVNPVSGQKEYPNQSITLLKMHGAMNWFPVPTDRKSTPRLQLRIRWWHQKGNLKFEIVPPQWNKPIHSGIYQRIWRKARSTLAEVKALIFIGYSLPETDLPAQSLLMVDAVKSQGIFPLELLVIVNPNQEARKRIRQVLLGRINGKTRIMTFDFFEQFSNFLGKNE
ncbi:MAG: SIR2 family protein [Elusimicrobia bacterium]|nr:SIR2 family protein [Elusimicrobiota bacterium]